MPRIEIYADTRGRSRCRSESCRAPIEWAEVVKSGAKMPFDGEIVPVASRLEDATGRLIEVVDTEVTKPHHATCPDAPRWRRR